MAAEKRRISVDVGGTFTDCLVLNERSGDLTLFKSPTTPADPSDGLVQVLGKAAGHFDQPLDAFLASVDVLIHGTTLATNVLLTGQGAKSAMLTTKNFRDILEIRRAIKPVDISLFNLFIPPNRPLIPRVRRIGIGERTLYTGEILENLNEDEVAQAVEGFKADGVEAVAVCFLHSYANPTNELRAAALVREMAPDMYVTTSHETIHVWREFERFNTTAVGAYVGPAVANYLRRMERRLEDQGFGGTLLMMLASGLVQTIDQCIDQAVYFLHSGPAAAPSAASYLGRTLGEENLLSVDMGGTSFDVGLVRGGEIPTTTESWVADQRVAIKMVDIESVGAGGGSIAKIDSLGLLKVGPESAGALPGPACFGHGQLPTVTDADLVLGYIPDDFFLGGEMKLDAGRARRAMESLGGELGLDAVGVAEAIFATVNATMADQIIEVSTKRGHDIRNCAMVAGGGGGPVHAGFIAERLGIPKVIVPSVAALYSAFGMFAMDLGEDYARSYVGRLADADAATANRLFAEMESEGRAAFEKIGIAAQEVNFKRTVDLRYIGQFHEVEVEMAGGQVTAQTLDGAAKAFERKHHELYTFSMPWKGIEMLTLRLKASTPNAPFHLPKIGAGEADASGAIKRHRQCRFDKADVETPVYDGEQLKAGNVIAGPAIIEEATTTVVIPGSFTCTVDANKNFILTRNQETSCLEGSTPMTRETVDPTTVATVWHSMQTATKEMRHIIDRTCQNFLISQLHDVSVGIWTADGETVAIPVGLPPQFLGAQFPVQYLIEKFKGNIHPGDVFLSNDPYHGGHSSHLPDWAFFRPIFYQDELVFFTMVRAHQQDTGGSFPGGYFPNGHDIHAEGICIPPIKVIDAGRERTDVFELIWNNVRFPDGVRIDNYAMIAATKVCEQRVISLLDTYGLDTVLACVKQMLDRTERAVRAEIRKIPDGVYKAEAATDDDGTELDVLVWVRVTITVKGDEMIIDFSESDKQRKGFVNSVYAASYGCATGAAILTFDPALADYHNAGSMRPIQVIAPLGTVVNSEYPATVGASPVSMGNQIMEAVLDALSQARPERAVAAWGKHRGDYVFAVDPRSGERYVRTSFDYDGSAGAVWGYDGYQGVTSLTAMGAINRGDVEEMEARLPWRLIKYEFVPDFTGAGRWRGGPGIHWVAVNEGSDGQMATGSSDGDVVMGFGAVGGLPSPQCRTYIERAGERIRIKPHRMIDLKAGDVVIKHSSGGGGVGDPAERDPEMVAEDVRNGLVSVAAALDPYRVVMDADGAEVDWPATERLRAAPAA